MSAELMIAMCLMIIAFLYASVGHGGASGYIAIMSLFNVPVDTYRPVVLTLNILIAGIAFIQFFRAGYFKWSLAWPFLLAGIPLAYFGSGVHLNIKIYNLLLGLALILAILRLIGFNPKEKTETRKISVPWALFIGGLIGFAAGMLNIGGGIFLSPILILASWTNAKQAAAVSSLYIVCNSIAGLAGGTNDEFVFNTTIYLWLTCAIAGGLAGAYFGSRHFKLITIQYLLAGVLGIACIKLIFLM
jgi:uncharacterized membrane protein YfcA